MALAQTLQPSDALLCHSETAQWKQYVTGSTGAEMSIWVSLSSRALLSALPVSSSLAVKLSQFSHKLTGHSAL